MTDTLQRLTHRARELQCSRLTSNEHINQLNDVAFNIRYVDPILAAELSNTALRLAAANDYDRGRAFALRNIGLYQIVTDQYKLAVDTLEQSRRICQRLQDQTELAAAIINVGYAQMLLGQHEQALDSLSLAYHLSESLDDKFRVANSLSAIAMTYRRMGNNVLTLENFYRGLRFADEAGLPDLQASLCNNLGHVFWRLGEADEAIKHLQQALPIFQADHNCLGESTVTLNLGAAYLAGQQHADALPYLERGLGLARELGSLQLQAEAHLRLGTIQREMGDISEAASSMWQALQIAQNISSCTDEAEALVEIGLLRKQIGELSEARELLEQAATFGTEFGYKEILYKAHLGLSQVCEAQGDAAAALRHHQAFYRVWSEVRGRDASLQLGRVLQQYKMSKATLLQQKPLIRQNEIMTSTAREQIGGLEARKLQQVIKHVKHNLERNLTVAELASVAAMAEKYFQYMFKQSTGKTPHQFVIEQRVARARRLLETSELPLSEIALRCGFSSQAHLSTQFRLVQGTTPKKYRKASN